MSTDTTIQDEARLSFVLSGEIAIIALHITLCYNCYNVTPSTSR